jgi:hypothetical protein
MAHSFKVDRSGYFSSCGARGLTLEACSKWAGGFKRVVDLCRENVLVTFSIELC